MKFLVFAVLAVVAFALIAGLVVGVAFKLIGLGIMALLVVAAVTFIMRKVRGGRDAERMPR